MATLTQAVNILLEISHLTEKQIRAISSKFQQVDLIPISVGRDVKHLSEAQFTLLFLACYVEVPGLRPVAAAQHYYGLTDENGQLAGEAIAAALTGAYANVGDAPTILIEVSDPAVCVGNRRFGAPPVCGKVEFRIELGPETLSKAASMWRNAAPTVT